MSTTEKFYNDPKIQLWQVENLQIIVDTLDREWDFLSEAEKTRRLNMYASIEDRVIRTTYPSDLSKIHGKLQELRPRWLDLGQRLYTSK